MRFASPEWALLFPFALFASWFWPQLQLRKPLRAFMLVLFVVALCNPVIERISSGLDLFVMIDRSASNREVVDLGSQEWEVILGRSRRGPDRLHFIDFAQDVVFRDRTDQSTYSSGRNASRLALAIEAALTQRDPTRTTRLLAISDGFFTDSLAGIAERLRMEGVSLDYRLVHDESAEDFQVTRLITPSEVNPGENFLVEVQINGTIDRIVPLEIRREDKIIFAGRVPLKKGRGVARFVDQLPRPSGVKYTARLTGGSDARSGNDIAHSWVTARERGGVLLLSRFENDPLEKVLTQQGVAVFRPRKFSKLHVGHLANADAVVVNDISAAELPVEFLQSLNFYVTAQGGGLVMIGGRRSFGTGGYFGSPVDEILPVSMELREEHRRLSVALSIVLDRSGSMTARVPGGGGLTKMELANEGAAQAIELLGPKDLVSVFAVDSEPHEMVPMVPIGNSQSSITDAVRRIESSGGGIFVYNGLQAAWEELQTVSVGQRHVVLFADAADAEQPGNYEHLVAEMVGGETTVSVIGLGTDTDADADFLEDIAKRGKGRVFFSEDPNTLPMLFVQEVASVARSAYIDDPVNAISTGRWREMARQEIKWPGEVDGFNLCYLRKDATAALLTNDDYKVPLVAFWQRGIGRSAAVTFPMAGEEGQRIRSWESYSDFLQTLMQWVMRDGQLPGVMHQATAEGDSVVVELFYAPEQEELISRMPPEGTYANAGASKSLRFAWERIRPGEYRARIALQELATVVGGIRVGEKVLPFGPLAAGVNHEWVVDRSRVAEVRAVSALSGGEERVDLAEAWNVPRTRSSYALRNWILVLFLVIFLLDALTTRLGWQFQPVSFSFWPALSKFRFKRASRKIETSQGRKEPAIEVEESLAATDVLPEPEKKSTSRASRFRRAKRKGL